MARGSGVAHALWNRVETERLNNGLTRIELAERTGLARSTIDRLKTGRRTPQPETVRALATELDIDLTEAFELAGLGPKPPPHTSAEEYAEDFKDDPEFQELLDQLPPRSRQRALEEWAVARERAREEYKRTLRLAAEAASDDSSDRRAR